MDGWCVCVYVFLCVCVPAQQGHYTLYHIGAAALPADIYEKNIYLACIE